MRHIMMCTNENASEQSLLINLLGFSRAERSNTGLIIIA